MDIYAEVTDRIIEELEKGIIPWNKPWTGVADGAIKRNNGKPYSLLNQMLLGKPGEYLTFNQCKKEGGTVKKGARSKMVVFWKFFQSERKDENGAIISDENGMPALTSIPMLRYYNVFHIDDCEGIKPKYNLDDGDLPNAASKVEKAEKIVDDYASRAKLKVTNSKQNKAYYSPSTHVVSIPLIEQFMSTESYYDTLYHELVHSTGHSSLLNRFGDNCMAAGFGRESYSKEELVAEIGSCGIIQHLGLETKKSFRNNAAYIQSWMRVLKNDKRLIVSAAGKAEKAIKLILNIADDKDEA